MAEENDSDGELIKDAVYGDGEGEDSEDNNNMEEYQAPQPQQNSYSQVQAPVETPSSSEEYTSSSSIYQESKVNREPQDYQAPQPQYSSQGYSETYSPPEQNYYSPNYNPYPQQQAAGVDVITEIADQIFEEKASIIREQLEKTLSFKNSVESKIDYLDERIKRIERVLDRLQLSILQKVGDQLTSIEDIKREMIETQKSFKALSEKHHSHK